VDRVAGGNRGVNQCYGITDDAPVELDWPFQRMHSSTAGSLFNMAFVCEAEKAGLDPCSRPYERRVDLPDGQSLIMCGPHADEVAPPPPEVNFHSRR
jgi:hypothetical protein